MNKKTQIAFKETLRPDIVIVHQMLTTGYDVNRLKKMYLLRNAKEHTLLQTISRVNRPYRNPEGESYQYGYITDFADIEAEYDRTIAMYLKELEQNFDDSDNECSGLGGIIVGLEDINKKYLKAKKELDEMADTSNLERFSKTLTFFNKDALLTIRRLLNSIKTCYTEFLLSRADEYSKQIDIAHTKKLLTEVQHRIDFLNLKSAPTNLMAIISNKEIVEILYEFFKVKITIMDMNKLTEAMKKVTSSADYQKMTETVDKIQNEIKRNKNHNQSEMIKLDELLKKIFEVLEIADLNDLSSINEELVAILKKMQEINEENEKLAARYDGNYAFVKTYTDAVEMYPDYSKEDIASVMDAVYAAVKDIKDSNILVLQGRDNFTASIKKATTASLLKSGLYKKLNMKEWYTSLLNEIYANMKIF